MKEITFNDAVSGEIKIAYSDYGQGRPVVLIHGWPLSREMWEYQLNDLVTAGYRVIKYDRRGFGSSSKPWNGYDYDTLTGDLHQVLEQLDLTDAVLVGFSMGGGEAVRYISKYGTKRVSGLVLISSVVPYLLKTDDNADGVDGSVFEEMQAQIEDDRIGFLEGFGNKFFGIGLLKKPVSKPLLNYYIMMGSKATAKSTQECAKSFSITDFRKDLKNIDVPTLIIHGKDDSTVPIKSSSDRTAEMLPQAEYIVYDNAPHGLFYTHKEQLNNDLINFLNKNSSTSTTAKEIQEVI